MEGNRKRLEIFDSGSAADGAGGSSSNPYAMLANTTAGYDADASSSEVDTIGLPYDATPNLGGIADDSATRAVSLLTDDFGTGVIVPSLTAAENTPLPIAGVQEEEGGEAGDVPKPSRSSIEDAEVGRKAAIKGDIYFDSNVGEEKNGEVDDEEITAYTGYPDFDLKGGTIGAASGLNEAPEKDDHVNVEGAGDDLSDQQKGTNTASGEIMIPSSAAVIGSERGVVAIKSSSSIINETSQRSAPLTIHDGEGRGGGERMASSNYERMTAEATADVSAAAATITHSVGSRVSVPGVMFVPGPSFTGQISTGYHSAHDDEDDESHTDNNPNLYNHDDIENQNHTTTLIEAYTVPENDDEAAEIIGDLQEQLGSARKELQMAWNQLLEAPVVVGEVVVEGEEGDGDERSVVNHNNNNTRKNRLIIVGFILLMGVVAVVVGLAVFFGKNNSENNEAADDNNNSSENVEEKKEEVYQFAPIGNHTMEGFSLVHVASKVGDEKGELLGTSNSITVHDQYLLSGSPGYSTTTTLTSFNSSGGDETVTAGKGGVFDFIALSDAASNNTATNNNSSNELTFTEQFADIFAGTSPGDRCGAAVTATVPGRHIAIGCPSTTGLGYVKVYEYDHLSSSSPPKQVLSTLYGNEINDGFGMSVALCYNFYGIHTSDQLRLAIGSNSGYAQLWGSDKGGWLRLDGDNGNNGGGAAFSLNHPEGKEGGKVTVQLAASGALHVGYPSFDSDRGMVRSFSVKTVSNNLLSLKERFDSSPYSFLQGRSQGDRFGSVIDTDLSGDFVTIGTDGGGYARVIRYVVDTPSKGEFRPVGNEIRLVNFDFGVKESRNGSSSSVSDFGSSVATGRLPYKGCRTCESQLDDRRVVVGSSGGFHVYQFVEEENLWYQIAKHESPGGEMVKVSMSPNTVHLGVGTPGAEDGRGRLDVYKILDHEEVKKNETMQT